MSDPVGKSPLDDFPNYTRAIGLIIVELAAMETELLDLLAALLGLSQKAANAVFFTPKSTRARIDILANLTPRLISDDKLCNKITDLVGNASKLLNHRNDYVHEVWGVDNGQVVWIPTDGRKARPVPISELTSFLHRIRALSDKLHWVRFEVAWFMFCRPHYRINVSYQITPPNAD
jgi:hypothetical protein